jgi:2-oxoglutarate dehydrogenase E2 component (dihydrolipoamide succinyltransferase)
VAGQGGRRVAIDQPLCELETDKVTVEVNATVAGTIVDLAVAEGATVQVGGVLCHIEAGAGGAAPPSRPLHRPRPPAGPRRPAAVPRARPRSPAANAQSRRLRPGRAQAREETGVAPPRSSPPARTAAPPRPT